MSNNQISFLPPIKRRKDFASFKDFINEIFELFITQFYTSKISFKNSIVKLSPKLLKCKDTDNCQSIEYNCNNCPFKDKPERFNHIVTGKNEFSRTPGKFREDRASRIHWIKYIIENHMDPQILYFHKPHKQKIRHYFWAKEENYIVIIQEEKRFQYFLITAFIVDDPTYYKRYEQDYKNYLSNFKKTHHVDGSIPLSTLTS